MPFNKLDHTAVGKIKPRFKLQTQEGKNSMLDLILTHANADDSVKVSSHTNQIKLMLPFTERHYWSPVMNLTCEWDDYDKKTYIRGVIGPNDKVWTMFTFFYIGIIMIGMFGGVFSLVKWQIHDDSTWLFVIPLCLFIFGSIFSTVKFGKRKAHTQMLHLLRFLRRAVDSVKCVRVND
jgi:hypothetical protein